MKNNIRTQELRQDMQARILKTALHLFARNGYGETSIRKIAAECGISLGLLYNYFDSKEILLKMIIAESLEDIQHSFEIDQSLPAEKKITQLIENVFKILDANMEFWRLNYALRMQTGILTEFALEIANVQQFILLQLEGFFNELHSKEPGTDARLLFATIDGLSQHYVINNRDYPLEQVKQKLIQQYTASK